MKKIVNILKSDNRITLKETKIKNFIKEMKILASEYSIKNTVKTELDFFEAKIIHQSLINKMAFEKVFEEERLALLEMWDHLSYQERNRLINMKLDAYKDQAHFFKNEDQKIIWMAFFDPLLNTLYHHDIAILELPQYFKLYKLFKDKMINIRSYGILPYQQKFIDLSVIESNHENVWFYSSEFRSLFCLNQHFECIRLPLSKSLTDVHPFKKDLLNITRNYEDKEAFMHALIESPLINEKVKTKLKQYQHKLYDVKP